MKDGVLYINFKTDKIQTVKEIFINGSRVVTHNKFALYVDCKDRILKFEISGMYKRLFEASHALEEQSKIIKNPFNYLNYCFKHLLNKFYKVNPARFFAQGRKFFCSRNIFMLICVSFVAGVAMCKYILP